MPSMCQAMGIFNLIFFLQGSGYNLVINCPRNIAKNWWRWNFTSGLSDSNFPLRWCSNRRNIESSKDITFSNQPTFWYMSPKVHADVLLAVLLWWYFWLLLIRCNYEGCKIVINCASFNFCTVSMMSAEVIHTTMARQL